MCACVCLCVQYKQRKKRTDGFIKNTKTPKVCMCVCVCVCASSAHFDDWGNLHQHLAFRVYICVCVCVFVWRVCVRLHKHSVRVMRCSLHPSVLLAFTSSEGDNRGEMERVGEGRRTEINGWLKRFYDSVFLSVRRAASLSRVTCGGSRPDLIYRTRLRVPECLREDAWEWSCSVSSCGCGLCASVSFFFFSWTVWETERTLIVLCLLICRLGGEARAVSPLSDVTRLWYRTPSSQQITDHPKNTPPFYHSGTLPLCSPHLLWLTVSSGVSVARTELCQTEIPRGAS